MKFRPDMKSRAFSIAVLLCVPLVIRCSSDSDSGGTSGAGGEGGPSAGNGGVAQGGHAGSGYAGSAGASTSGGTDAAGTGGSSAGTGGSSAGTGGSSAGTGGDAGASGDAGAGGDTGVAGAGPGILNVSLDSLLMFGDCTAPPQTFTISNTGQSALTWNAALSLPLVAVAPSSSTLLPGTEVTVSVTTTTPVQLTLGQDLALTITSDVPAQPPAVISIFYGVSGTMIGVQPDIDVGEVPLGQSKTVSVPAPPHTIELALSSTNSAFSVPDALVHGADHWTMIFTPQGLGPQSSTLQIIVPFGSGGPVCPTPNLFTARGVGIAP